MDLDATAAFPNPSRDVTDPLRHALFIGRRAIGWLVDGFLLSIVLSIAWLVLSLLAVLFVSAAVGAAGDGLGGLAAGGAAGFAAVGLVVVLFNVIGVGSLVAYFRWAARRTGTSAGQTLGHQLVAVRVVDAEDPSTPIRGRRFVGRELARYLWLTAVAIPALVLMVVTESTALGNLGLFAAVAAVLWWSPAGRFPHDRLANTRVVAASARHTA